MRGSQETAVRCHACRWHAQRDVSRRLRWLESLPRGHALYGHRGMQQALRRAPPGAFTNACVPHAMRACLVYAAYRESFCLPQAMSTSLRWVLAPDRRRRRGSSNHATPPAAEEFVDGCPPSRAMKVKMMQSAADAGQTSPVLPPANRLQRSAGVKMLKARGGSAPVCPPKMRRKKA